MLIIFDLDDTLIDTSGVVTPLKLHECVKYLVNMGHIQGSLEEVYQTLFSLNAKSLKSKDALVELLQLHGLNLNLLKNLLDILVSKLPSDFKIKTTPFAIDVLHACKEKHQIACVTGGNPVFQLEKMEKAGIDRSIFSKILIAEDSKKKPYYKALLHEFSISPQSVIVCGDRVEMDLLPAFELGMTTVHMMWGRGKLTQSKQWVHHEISQLNELKRIIKL